jgi:endonuclease-3
MLMVILSVQDSVANINKIAPAPFKMYPNMENLAFSNTKALILQIANFKTSEQNKIR